MDFKLYFFYRQFPITQVDVMFNLKDSEICRNTSVDLISICGNAKYQSSEKLQYQCEYQKITVTLSLAEFYVKYCYYINVVVHEITTGIA